MTGPERAPSWRPSATIDALHGRAALRSKLRSFMQRHKILEVEVPLLQGGANLDRGVQPMALAERWLITSPEHPLKRLLAAGSGDVWTLCPCFRAGEQGLRHAPEFCMLEWYRLGFDDRQMAQHTVDLLNELCGPAPIEQLSWAEAMQRHGGLNGDAPTETLSAALDADEARAAGDDRLDLLDLIFATRIQPRLGQNCWTIISDWPPASASQARLRGDGRGGVTAARFEIFREGLELANGYWELSDPDELARRLTAEQTERDSPPARDRRFEAAIVAGLPDCAGVAVGFDRVAMLALGLDRIDAVQAFGWEVA